MAIGTIGTVFAEALVVTESLQTYAALLRGSDPGSIADRVKRTVRRIDAALCALAGCRIADRAGYAVNVTCASSSVDAIARRDIAELRSITLHIGAATSSKLAHAL